MGWRYGALCDAGGDELVTAGWYRHPMDAPRQPLTFIVRLTPGEGGLLGGVVERVRSGEKQRFDSVAALADLITEMVERETTMKRQKQPTR
jgi:hypothetical protein